MLRKFPKIYLILYIFKFLRTVIFLYWQVVALKNTEEQRLGVRNNAKVKGYLTL